VPSTERAVARNTLFLIGGRLVNGLLGVVSVALMTRYLGVARYGSLVTAMLVLSVLGSIADSGLTNLGVRELAVSTRERAGRVMTALLALRLLTGGAAVLVATCLAAALSGNAQVALLLLVPTLLVSSAQAALSVPLEAQLLSTRLVVGDIGGRVLSLGLLLVAVETDSGFVAVVLSQAAGVIVNALVDGWMGLAVLRPHWPVDRPMVRQLARRSVAVGVLVVLNTLYFRVDGLLLAALKGAKEVGVYGVAYRLPELLMTFPAYLVVSALPVLSGLADAPEQFSGALARFVRPLVLVVLPVAAGGAVVAKDVVLVLAGKEFGNAVAPTRLLLAAMVPYFVSTLYGAALLARDRDAMVARVAAITLVLNVVGNLVLIPVGGAAAAAGVLVLTEVFVLLALGRGLGRASAADLRWLPKPLLATAAMALLVLGCDQLLSEQNAAVRLVSCTLIGAAVYVALVWRLRLWSSVAEITAPGA
jgi:lipopolysaccharide exporter